MKYTYNIILHNSENMTIDRACAIADTLEGYLNDDYCHIQAVGLGQEKSDVKITIETIFKLDDLFNVIYDNRVNLNYKDFSIYYSEGYKNVGKLGYGA